MKSVKISGVILLGVFLFCPKVISAAELRVYCFDIDSSTTPACSTIQVYTTSPFDEDVITWNVRPPLDVFLTDLKNVNENVWYSFSSPGLTQYVDSMHNLSNPVCFGLKAELRGPRTIVWGLGSKEWGWCPELIYNSQTYYATEDARVDEAKANTNLGDSHLWACDYGFPDRQASYIQFSLPSSIEEENIKENSWFLRISPNPFSRFTVISFQLPDKLTTHNSSTGSDGRLTIHDITGRLIRSLQIPELTWDGCDELGNQVPSGMYFIKLKVGDYSATEKIIKLK